MVRSPAVGVHDDLASGEATVALRAADHEAAGGVDQVIDAALDQMLRQDRFDDLLDDALAQLLERDVGGMLRGQDDLLT